MKISKLFHWLYACLLLLPIACFLPNAFYYGFNAQAQASERIVEEVNYYNTTNSVPQSFDNVEENTIYTFTITDDDFNGGEGSKIYFDYLVPVTNLDNYSFDTTIYEDKNYIYFDGELWVGIANTGEYEIDSGWSTFLFDIEYDDDNLNNFTDYNGLLHLDNPQILIPNGTNNTTTYTNSITDSMSVAWQQTWSNPLFSWAQDSFIALPFAYITNIFSIPVSNTFTIALSYWLSISVIWLCFDVLMYVPMLVHRWLDRSAIK